MGFICLSTCEKKRPINDDYKGGRIFIGGLCVLGMSLITTCIGVCSCRITLVVLISAMVLTRSSAEEEPVRKLRSTNLLSLEDNSIPHSKTRNGKEANHRGKAGRTWDLEPLIVKLGSVFNRYKFNWKEVKVLYAPVEPCMPDKCGRSQRWKFKTPKRFKCAKFKRRKILKKKILRILSKFQSGIQSIFWSFQDLIVYASFLKVSDERRINILNEFKNDIKMLLLEVESLMAKKRLKPSRKRAMATFPNSPILTILINELTIIQHSKEFLIAWKKPLSSAFKCWNKGKTEEEIASVTVVPLSGIGQSRHAPV